MAQERTLVQIRERPMVDLLDLALVVARRWPATLGMAALAGVAPFAALNAWAFGDSFQVAPGLPLFLWLVEAPLATAPLTVVLGGLMFGHRPTPGRVLSTLARSAVGLVVVNGFLRIVACFLIPTHLAFANEVVLLERGKWWRVFRRGGDLGSGRSGELFLLGVVQFVLVYVFAAVFYVGTGRIQQAVLAEGLTWDRPDAAGLASFRFQFPMWLVVSFFAIARFLTYIDQRIRLEGWEVELRLRAVGEALEEARRW